LPLEHEPEVRELRDAELREEDVVRLHVAVDEPARLGVLEGPRDRDRDLDRVALGERPVALEPVARAAALHELHREEEAPRLLAAAAAVLLLAGGAVALVKRATTESASAVEDRVARDLRDRLLRWRAPDGKGFGTAFDMSQSDAWSTAEAAAALAALGDPAD